MESKAKSATAYLAELPPERKSIRFRKLEDLPLAAITAILKESRALQQKASRK